MSKKALSPRPMVRAALALEPHSGWFIVMGFVALGAAAAIRIWQISLGLVVLGMTMVALTAVVKAFRLSHVRALRAIHDIVADVIRNDATPCIATDADGEIDYVNRAARKRFGEVTGHTLVGVLDDLFASPASVVYRLQNRAQARGSANEDVVLRNGHMRLSVHVLGGGGFLWRLDDLGDVLAAGHGGEAISLPMMTLSRNGAITFMNEALRRLLGGRETTLDRVFTDLPLRTGEIHHIAAARGPVPVLVVEVEASPNRRELYLLPEPSRLILRPGEWGVVESLPVPLLRLDSDGRITMANRLARVLLNDEKANGSHLSDQVEGLGRPVSDWLHEAWHGRYLGRKETVRASKADERFLQISLEQFQDDDGPALVAVLNDATELKTLETQFVQSQKMQAIGQLAGGVAHDFNNLLTAISGHCDLLLLRHDDEEDPDYADLSQISQNANRAAALVGQLLAFSRKQTLRPEVIDLTDTLGDLTHLLGRLVGERIQLEFRTAPGISQIRADKRQLEQVLMNLVVNARDAMMPDGGHIQLLVDNLKLAHPLERDRAVVPAGEYVAIRVIDQGHGISPEKLGKIFEPFFTTKGAGKGTGLGLSMAYGIVKQSGGFIFVDSVEGAGTTFTLYFPVFHEGAEAHLPEPAMAAEAPVATEEAAAAVKMPEPPAAEPAGPAASLAEEEAEAGAGDEEGAEPGETEGSTPLPAPTHEAPELPGGVVLLVEDEAPVRAFASRALRMKGYTVLEAENAEEALKTLEDEALDVDVFVTDVIMPGMDGPTWVTEALRKRPGVRVVFMSGYAEDSVSEHQARIPNSVFLPKPFSLSELTATVSRQLH